MRRYLALLALTLTVLFAGCTPASSSPARKAEKKEKKILLVLGEVSGGKRPVARELKVFKGGVLRLGTPSGKNPRGLMTQAEEAWLETHLKDPDFLAVFAQAEISAFMKTGVDQPRLYLRMEGRYAQANLSELPPAFRGLVLKLRPAVQREFRQILLPGL